MAFGWKVVIYRKITYIIKSKKIKLIVLSAIFVFDSINKIINLHSKAFILESPFIAYLFAFQVLKIFYFNKLANETSKRIRVIIN